MKKINLVLISVLLLSALFFACKTEADAPKTYYTVTIDQGFGSGLTNTSYQVEKGTPLKSSQLEGKPTIVHMIPTYKAADGSVYTLDQTEVNDNLALKIEWADDPSINCTNYEASKFVDYVLANESVGIACAIKKGAKVDSALLDGKTALHIVSSANQLEIVKFLLTHGADIAAKDINLKTNLSGAQFDIGQGKTAFLWASNDGSTDVVKYLLAHGSKIDERDKNQATALMLAATGGYYELVKYLLESAGCKISEKDKDNWTALMYAVSSAAERTSGDRLATVKYLASYTGVDLSIRSSVDNKTALGIAKAQVAANPTDTVYAEIVKYLQSISAPE